MSRILRKFFLPIIFPSALVSITQQSLLVVLPLYVLAIGGSWTESAMIIGIKGMGMMLADLPASLLIARFGDKKVMLCAAFVSVCAILILALFPTLAMVSAAALLLGLAHATWLVARISFVTEVTAVNERGRVMSLSAGTIRLGNVIGPAMAGVLIATAGYQVTLAVFAMISALVLLFVVLWVPFMPPRKHDSHKVSALKSALIDNRKVFYTAGVASIALMLVRSSRALLLPLTGAALLLDESSIGMAFSAGASIDTLLFYPAGSLMDRVGRKPILVTSLILLGAGLMLLPLAEGFYSLVVIASLLGLANGISAGVIMTVGADLAPNVNRGGFIGIWRLLSDVGSTSGPIIIGLVVKFSGLAAATYSIGFLGLLGGVYVIKMLTETNRKSD